MKRDKMVHRVHQVAFHRNGIGGNGFHAVVFDHNYERCARCKGLDSAGWQDVTGKRVGCPQCKVMDFESMTLRMVGIVFDEDGCCAVLDIDRLVDPAVGVAFGENSWRGDRFEHELREAIVFGPSDGSVRMGPFAIPTERVKK